MNAADLEALKYVAGKLRVPSDWLAAVINFETAGTWDPKIKNPHSSGRGLIQFMDATSRAMGYNDSLDLVTRHPSISSQLRGPVLKYFQQWKEPARDKQDFYFRVFLPELRKAPQETIIYAGQPTKQAAFRRANPGIETVGDYYRKLEARFAKFQASEKFQSTAKQGGGVFIALAIIGLFLGRLLSTK